MDDSPYRPLHLASCSVVCSSCNLREICLPVGLNRKEMAYIDQRMVTARRKVPRGHRLFQAGDRFDALYAVWTGFFKTCVSSTDGREQVTGFQMGGELLGLDGIGSGRHEVDAVSLEECQVCVIPFETLTTLAKEIDTLQQQLQRIMSREIVRTQGQLMLLGSMHAEERLAAFLLNLTHRLEVRGFSPLSMVLRMTREEIGSYLGLKLETVSRTFSKFADDGIVEVKQRYVRIVDTDALRAIVNAPACAD